jgi:hypothetical protein
LTGPGARPYLWAAMVQRISPRVAMTMALVLMHLVGATHMAFVVHTLSSTGAVVEATPRAHESHAHDVGSLCEQFEAPSATWGTTESCEAAAWSRVAGRPVHAPVAHVDPCRAVVARELRTHETAWAPPPLVVAPKSSPPRVG